MKNTTDITVAIDVLIVRRIELHAASQTNVIAPFGTDRLKHIRDLNSKVLQAQRELIEALYKAGIK